jgi:hypothetical protein
MSRLNSLSKKAGSLPIEILGRIGGEKPAAAFLAAFRFHIGMASQVIGQAIGHYIALRQ